MRTEALHIVDLLAGTGFGTTHMGRYVSSSASRMGNVCVRASPSCQEHKPSAQTCTYKC